MVDINDQFFQLQARTKLAKGGGTATIFAAAVAKEESTSTVQVALKEGGQWAIRDFSLFSSTLDGIREAGQCS